MGEGRGSSILISEGASPGYCGESVVVVVQPESILALRLKGENDCAGRHWPSSTPASFYSMSPFTQRPFLP